MNPTDGTIERKKLGRYRLVQRVAQGGMGEVYRAFDERTNRYVALKGMRQHLMESQTARQRFLHEAQLTASLNHPSIIPIFEIARQGDLDYYTMPFIQGQTLKETLRQMNQRGEHLHVMATARIFTSVCQAVVHAHTSGILHRDLKAENIMLGQHEQVLILDWGLACWKGAPQLPGDPSDPIGGLTTESPGGLTGPTNPGKIVGTLAYLAPERLAGPATERTDLYSLGILLFLMLTHQLPYRRKSAEEFRKRARETPVDPRELAPHRDIPEMLVRILERAMHPDPERRYDSADRLVADLQTFLEGRSSWTLLKRFDADSGLDWAIQEHVFIDRWPAEIVPSLQGSWVNWMVSKPTHSGNFRLEFAFRMEGDAQGIGLILNLPDGEENLAPLNGFCLWIASPQRGGAILCREGSALIDAPHIRPEVGRRHTLRVEKIDNALYCAFDGVSAITYVSTLPLVGSHIGLLCGGGGIHIESLDFFAGGLSLKTSCLSVPDHFLAARIYPRALAEYRRIAEFFSGHSEGQKARFLAGITLLEMARDSSRREKGQRFQRALEEFEKLSDSPSAPLEWLGKALTYRHWGQWAEEANCLELGCLRYPNNPKRKFLREEIISQLFAAWGKNRKLAARLTLLLARSLPEDLLRSDTSAQVQSLRDQLDLPAHFLHLPPLTHRDSLPQYRWQLVLEMSYWLHQPEAIIDSIAALSDAQEGELFEIYNAMRLIGVSHAKSIGWLASATDKKLDLADFQMEERLFTAKKGAKEWEKTIQLIERQALGDFHSRRRVLRGLYWSALIHLRGGDFSGAEERVAFVDRHFPGERGDWQWCEVWGLIHLARGDAKALLKAISRAGELAQLQQEEHPLFCLYASAALLDDRGVGNAIWNCAQFARKISVRLAANCAQVMQRREPRGRREHTWSKCQELAERAFQAEGERVYRLLLALRSGLGLKVPLNRLQFLLPKRH